MPAFFLFPRQISDRIASGTDFRETDRQRERDRERERERQTERERFGILRNLLYCRLGTQSKVIHSIPTALFVSSLGAGILDNILDNVSGI